MVNAMSKRSLRNVETRKKKARRAIPRAKVTRDPGQHGRRAHAPEEAGRPHARRQGRRQRLIAAG